MSSSSALLLLLFLYPVTVIAMPKVFFRFWPRMRPPVPNLAATTTEGERAALADLGVWLPLFTYATLILGVLLWLRFFSVDLDRPVLSVNKWLTSVLIGAYLGTAWAGASIWLLALGAATGRMRREIPGLIAPLKFQSAVWLLGAFTEETWRAIAIVALLKVGNSPLFSIVAVSVAFGCGYLRLGLQRVAVASLDGLFFGFLYLWRGSFFAPFLAHLVIQAVYLWGIGQLSLNRKTRKTWQIPGTKCPVCQKTLELLQIRLKDVFECPSCNATLSVSDAYQEIQRFVGAFGFLFTLFCSIVLLTIWLPYYLGVLLTYPITLAVMTSGFLLYQRTFVRLFPPQLQRGTPYFITLNLGPRRESKKTSSEDQSEEDGL